MFFPFISVLLSAQLITAVADELPHYDINTNCRANAAASAGIGFPQSVASCKQDEQNARDQLIKEWAQFRPSDRSNCTGLASEGEAHSYVELLTCLQMARDATTLPGAK
jgi:hypothetical protein